MMLVSHKKISPEYKSTPKDLDTNGEERSPESASGFAEHRAAMTQLSFPDMQPNSSLKDRLSILEDAVNNQYKMNALTYQTFGDAAADLEQVDLVLKTVIQSVRASFEKEITSLRREYDHRFELQAAENRRLQQSFANLKAESSQTNKKLILTIEKLRALQLEFGVNAEEDEADDFSVLAMSVSRPNTSNMRNTESPQHSAIEEN